MIYNLQEQGNEFHEPTQVETVSILLVTLIGNYVNKGSKLMDRPGFVAALQNNA